MRIIIEGINIEIWDIVKNGLIRLCKVANGGKYLK
jgi:hypothetical protein